jgi:hypothetical protein
MHHGRRWLFGTETWNALSGADADAADRPSTRIRTLVGKKCFLASSGSSPLLQAMAQIIAAATSSQAIPTALM